MQLLFRLRDSHLFREKAYSFSLYSMAQWDTRLLISAQDILYWQLGFDQTWNQTVSTDHLPEFRLQRPSCVALAKSSIMRNVHDTVAYPVSDCDFMSNNASHHRSAKNKTKTNLQWQRFLQTNMSNAVTTKHVKKLESIFRHFEHFGSGHLDILEVFEHFKPNKLACSQSSIKPMLSATYKTRLLHAMVTLFVSKLLLHFQWYYIDNALACSVLAQNAQPSSDGCMKIKGKLPTNGNVSWGAVAYESCT